MLESSDAEATFIERLGMNAQADGLPRIAGRMMGFFIIHGGPFSFSELAEQLQISRGSVSTNARILMQLGVLDRTAKPGDRQDYYQLADHPYARMLEGYVYRMQGLRDMVGGVNDALPEGNEQRDARLNQFQHFYDVAIKNTSSIISQLRIDRDAIPDKAD